MEEAQRTFGKRSRGESEARAEEGGSAHTSQARPPRGHNRRIAHSAAAWQEQRATRRAGRGGDDVFAFQPAKSKNKQSPVFLRLERGRHCSIVVLQRCKPCHPLAIVMNGRLAGWWPPGLADRPRHPGCP